MTARELPPESCCDVAVIGSGPAGATAAALLARRGWRVVMLEQRHHPRFHIGESLLPANLELFQRLGLLDAVAELGVHKPGAEFIDEHGARSLFDFSGALAPRWRHAYQVRRAEFDALLAGCAQRSGAVLLEGHKVHGVEIARDGVRLQVGGPAVQALHARQLIDASGRDTVLARRFRDKRANRRHASAALFGHFRNVTRRDGPDAGLISIYWFAHGWFWLIPLRDGITSVGAVCDPAWLRARDCPPAEYFQRTLALAPEGLRRRMACAEPAGPVQATGNYSYRCEAMLGRRWVRVGDAWAFVDPVFSSGVLLAMNSAFLAADLVDARLRGSPRAPLLAWRMQRIVRRGVRRFSWLIERFNSPVLRRLFLAPANPLRLQEAVTSVLAGDVFGHRAVDWRYALFRWIYRLHALAMWRQELSDRRRRHRRAATRFAGGTLPEDEA